MEPLFVQIGSCSTTPAFRPKTLRRRTFVHGSFIRTMWRAWRSNATTRFWEVLLFQNVVERGVLLCDSEVFVVEEAWLRRDTPTASASNGPMASTLEDREREMIEAAL